MPYAEVSITGYNSNPPEDDGSAVSSNEVSWAKHKDKIGDPLKTAIEATQTAITTVVNSIEGDQIEAGTAMLFMQTAAPTGWTKDTTANLNNTALRLTTGTVTSRTTQSNFTTVFGLTSTDGFTLANSHIPIHAHSLAGVTISSNRFAPTRATGGVNDNDWFSRTQVPSSPTNVDKVSGWSGSVAATSLGALGLSGSMGDVGGGNPHSHGMDIRVNYHDVIRATKD